MKKIVVGVDGACWKLLDRFIQKGELPNFKKLKKEGSNGVLKSTLPPITVPAWISMFTGRDPGELGLYSFQYYDPKQQKMKLVNSTDVDSEFIWEMISPEKRSIVINVPGTYPPQEFNGIMITGSLTPSKLSNFAYPKTWEDKIDDIADGYILEPTTYQKTKKKVWEDANKAYDKREKVAKHLFKNEDFDLFVVVFRLTDIVQHKFWDKKEKVLKTYKKIDDFLGFLLENLDEEDKLTIVSDHGFMKTEKNFRINEWLRKEGYLQLKEKEERGKSILGKILKKTYGLIKKLGLSNKVVELLPGKYRKEVKRLIETSEEGVNIFNALEKGDIDYEKEKAISLVSGQRVSMLKTNCNEKELIKELEGLKRNGKKFIDIKRSDETYKKVKEGFPELVVKLKDHRISSNFEKGEIFFKKPSAIHDMDGVFLSNKKLKDRPKEIPEVVDWLNKE